MCTLIENELPQGINQFRIGEAIIIGRDSTGNRCVPGTRQDTVKTCCRGYRVKEETFNAIGKIGKDALVIRRYLKIRESGYG